MGVPILILSFNKIRSLAQRHCPDALSYGRQVKHALASWGIKLVDTSCRLIPLHVAQRRVLRQAAACPAWAPKDGIELVARLSASLRALKDEDGGNRRLHCRWVSLFERVAKEVGGQLGGKKNFQCVYLGAGVRNPWALPLLLHQWGAARVYLVEPDVISEEESWRARWGLQEMVLRLLTGNVTSPHFMRRAEEIADFVDPQALFYGTGLDLGLNKDRVILMKEFFEDCPIPGECIDLLLSRSTLEHITQFEACFDRFATAMSAGGVMFHDIDLSAHSDGDPFAFYYADVAETASRRSDGLNGLRLSDYVKHFEQRGFNTTVVDKTVRREYAIQRSRVLPRFQGCSDEDLLCSRAVLVAQKRLAWSGGEG